VCARWSGYLSDGRTDVGDAFRIAELSDQVSTAEGAHSAMVSGLRRILELTQEVGGQVWVLLEVPLQPVGPHRRGIDAMFSGSLCLDGTSRQEHAQRMHAVQSVLAEVSKTASDRLHVIDLAEPLFDASGTSRVGRPGVSWYFDDDHLSPAGAEELAAPLVSEMFQRIAANCGPVNAAPTSAPAP
jgi:hypothetical protein